MNSNPNWPKHKAQNHISNPHTTKASNTKIRPIFSAPKHKTQNQIQTSDLNLRAETKPLATSDSKLSNPNGINLKPDNKTTSSLSRHYFLLSRVCLGCGFERTRERGEERQTGWDCMDFNEKESMKD